MPGDGTSGLRHPLELRVQECHVERGIVDDQFRPADELEKFLGNLAELRLSLQELGGQAVHLQRARVDLAIGAQVAMKEPPGTPPVDQFDAADLDDPMTQFGLEAGGLGIEDDLAHQALTASTSAATTVACWASTRYGCIGRLITRPAAASDRGKLPAGRSRYENAGCWCSDIG